jgi:outer membrane protein assembly factor BamB
MHTRWVRSDATAFEWPSLPGGIDSPARAMKTSTCQSLVLLFLLVAAVQGPAQEWTRLRGPNGSGLSAAKTIPSQWTEQDFNWKVPLPGPGHSSPVVWGDNIFLTTGDDQTNQLWVLCVSARQGRILWQQAFPLKPYHKNANNSVASSTPAVDEHRVYVCWAVPERQTLMALDHAGHTVWEKDLGPYAGEHGSGASPIVYQDQVILANEQNGESFILAVEAATGRTRWQTPRKTTFAAYATPCVYQPTGSSPTLIFASRSHGLYGVDPANGSARWELTNSFDRRVVSSPVLAADLIIGACGGEGVIGSLVAVRPGQPVADQKPEVAYIIHQAAPYVPTSICVGNLLFLWADDGVVSCLQAASGKVLWQQRLGKHYFSSPVCVEGRLFGVSTSGEVAVLRAADSFELLARNPLGERTHSTPAVAGGRMYIHTVKHLLSLGGRAEAAARN